MIHRDADEVHTEEGDSGSGGGRGAVQVDTGAGGIAVDGAECVLEDALDDGSGFVVGVERDAFRTVEAERAKIVHAEDVIGVGMSVENRVDGVDVLADGLVMEVRAGVDEDGVLVVVDGDAGASAAIGRVGLPSISADGAGAAERGNSHAGARAEKSKRSMHKAMKQIPFGEWKQEKQLQKQRQQL